LQLFSAINDIRRQPQMPEPFFIFSAIDYLRHSFDIAATPDFQLSASPTLATPTLLPLLSCADYDSLFSPPLIDY